MLTKENIEDIYTLSPLQEGMYFHALQKNSHTYFEQTSYRLQKKLDEQLVEQTFNELVKRHAVLRTVFNHKKAGRPLQVVLKQRNVDFSYHDIRSLDEQSQVSFIRQYKLNDKNRSFDLSRDVLMRIAMLQVAEGQYEIIWSFHHIILDGWSLGVLASNFFLIYQALENKRALSATPAPQFKTYIDWLEKQDHEKAKRYWANYLTQYQEPCGIYTIGRKTRHEAYEQQLFTFDLSAAQTAFLSELAKRLHVTVNTVVQCLWGVLLSNYNRTNDVVFGTIVSGRPADVFEVEQVVGMFINTIPLRIQYGEDTTFTELVSIIRQQTLEREQYSYYSLAEIQQLTPLKNKLLDHVLSFQNLPVPDNTGDMVVSKVEVSSNNTNFTVRVQQGATMQFEIFYDASVFHQTILENIQKHITHLIGQLQKTSDVRVRALRVTPGIPSDDLFYVVNNTARSYPAETIQQIFERQVLKTPQADALSYNGEKLSYVELNEKVNTLAHYLRETCHCQPNTVIAMMMNRSDIMVIALLAIIKSGAAYLPIDPEYPVERIRHMLTDSQAGILITESDYMFTTSEFYQGELIALDIQFDTQEPHPDNLELINASSDLCYMIYTSGSTGTPKGVQVEHRGVVNMSLDQVAVFGIQASDRVLQFASISFDASISEILMALFCGASVCLVDKVVINDLQKFEAFMAEEQITVATLPPAYLNVFNNRSLGSLRVLITAGESANQQVATAYAKQLSYFNAYGPTEYSVCATIHKVTEQDAKHDRVPVGKPISNTHIYILDDTLHAVPLGVAGELCIAGVGLARGYWQQPALTESKFISCPWNTNEKLYRTGDLALLNPDGTFEILGRIDKQVKVRGHRIEPGEIEECIQRHPQIDTAVVVAREVKQEKQLIAYLKKKNKIELWPSLAEFFVYDDVLYKTMAGDQSRNEKYRNAMAKVLKGKVVLEVGPGADVILSRLCIEQGAKKVYAVEILEEAYKKAKETIRTLHLENKIILLHGDASTIQLPEPVDYCVSEIVGSIGGSEGAARIINSVKRLMKDPSCMIPARSLTRIAAITLPQNEFEMSFETLGAYYVDKIFEQVGRRFDLRLCLHRFPKKNVISTTGVFEDLDFRNTLALEGEHVVRLDISRTSRLHGFIVWLNLYCDDDEVIDTLEKRYIWLPIYLPVFSEGVDVVEGDYVHATVTRTLGSNGLNPDFFIEGKLVRQAEAELDFTYVSRNAATAYKGNPFYNEVFKSDTLKITPGIDVTEIKSAIGRHLPDYMIPSLYVPVEEIPITLNGKIDYRSLPDPEVKVRTREHVAAANEIEETLVAVWCDILGRSVISTDDDFFEIGGDSIKAIRIAASANKALRTQIEVGDLYRYPNIRQLAVFITQTQDFAKREKEWDEAKHQIEAIKQRILEDPQVSSLLPSDMEDLYPMTDIQKGMLYHTFREGATGIYHDQIYSEIVDESFDTNLFKQAVMLLGTKHAILRTSFNLTDYAQPIQIVHKADEFNWDINQFDISNISTEEQHRLIHEYCLKDRAIPFNVNKPGLWRFRVFKRSPSDYGILFITHHSIIDGWSDASLLTELSNIYYSLKDNSAYKPAMLKSTYKDYVIDQYRVNQSVPLRQYWVNALQGYQRSGIPLNKNYNTSTLQGENRFHKVSIDEKLNEQILGLCDTLEVSIKSVCLAAFVYLMKMTTNSTDVTVGLVTNGRPNIADGDKMLGCFLNTVPFRISDLQGTSGKNLIRQVHERSNEIKSYDKLSLIEIVKEIGAEQDTLNPIFDTIYNFMDFHIYEDTHVNTMIKNSDLEDHVKTNTPFDFHLQALGKKVKFSISYLHTLYNKEEIARIAHYYVNILRQLCANPDQLLQGGSLLDAGEADRLVRSFNNNKVAFPSHHTLVDLVESAALEHANDIAVYSEDRSLKYASLNRKANQLADFLQKEVHVRSGDRVGILIERTEFMMVSILAILKAGAAYVPIDPLYPKERIAYILEDAQIGTLITSTQHRTMCDDLQWEISGFSKYVILNEEHRAEGYEAEEEGSKQLWNFIAKEGNDDFTASGWIDSYTKQAFPRADMDEFITNVSSKLAPCLTPQSRVLEVGSGSGMILFEIAPMVKSYTGTDISDEVLNRCSHAVSEKGLVNVELFNLTAHSIDTLQSTYDIIIVNSVVQYFPTYQYFREFLSKAARLLTKTGVLFLGDIRDKALQSEYYRSLFSTLEPQEAETQVQQKQKTESELFIDRRFISDYFLQAPHGTTVEFSRKNGRIENELSLYRYDALISFNNEVSEKPVGEKPSKQHFSLLSWESYSGENHRMAIRESDVAYLIYTSGSTGKPKGIEITHFNATQFVYWAMMEFDKQRFDVVYATTSYCFDLSVFEFFFTLSSGKPLRILQSGAEIPSFLPADKRVLVNTVPSLVAALLQEDVDFSNITVLNMAGEPIPHFVKEQLDYERIEVRNLYGPSEDTTYSSCYRFDDAHHGIPIGKPIANTSFYILDLELNLLPEGVIGELCISGDGIAKGYFRREELTRSRFVEDPFDKQKRMYKTGDLARWLADGNMEFIGRKDNQVKVKGYRIELGEIETVLSKHPAVKEAVAIVRTRANLERYVIAYLTFHTTAETKDLQLFLNEKLPHYMVPSSFVVLPEMPLNANGKIDRKALPAPEDLQKDKHATIITAPRNAMEEKLLEIWKRVLGREQLGTTDSFYTSGGDSIKAIQVISRMHKLGYKLEVKDIFHYPTIEKLAATVRPLRHVTDQRPVEGVLSLSPVQKSFFEKQLRHPEHYNQSVLLYFKEGLDPSVVNKLMNTLQDHHDVLRTVFPNGKDGVKGYNRPLHEYSETVVKDYRDSQNPFKVFEEEADKWQRSLNIETGPLVRTFLSKFPDGDRLLIIVHHLLIDAVSWRILFEDIETLYRQITTGQEMQLPLKTDSFKTWTEHLIQYANSPSFLKEREYWMTVSSDDTLPIDRVGENADGETVQSTLELNVGLTEILLTKVNAAYNTEINDVLLTALGMAVNKVFGIHSVLIAMEGHGRPEEMKNIDVSRTVGWFTTFYPVVLDMSHITQLGRQLITTKEYLRKIPGKGMGYGVLKYLTDRTNHSVDLPDLHSAICFNYLGQFDQDVRESLFEIADNNKGKDRHENEKREFPIEINSLVYQQKLITTITYSERYTQKDLIDQLQANYRFCLEELINHCASVEVSESTPSDFDYKELTLEDLDTLFD